MTSHRVLRLSLVDQTTVLMREGIADGRWKIRMPGQARLSGELGVARETVSKAITRLVSEGILQQADGRQAPLIRADALSGSVSVKRGNLRVGLLFADATESKIASSSAMMAGLVATIHEKGHTCVKYALPLGKDIHKTGYLPGLVKAAAVDAWLVYGGTLEVLTWFSKHVPHVMALGGRCTDLQIAAAASNVLPALCLVTQRLIALGHRRIVLICYRGARHPSAGQTVLKFREILRSAGISPGAYHVPDWEESPAGLENLLDSCFLITPPTALICWTLGSVNGALGWLTRRRISVPQDVSLVSLGSELATDWFHPSLKIANVQTDDTIIGDSVMAWLNGIITGQAEQRQTWFPFTFDEGNSIGPVQR